VEFFRLGDSRRSPITVSYSSLWLPGSPSIFN
jgi:hypothetical protein